MTGRWIPFLILVASAISRAEDLLCDPPTHLPKDREAAIRNSFDIRLPEER